MNTVDINKYNSYFFIGVAGAGMSAIAQYLSGIGKKISGSDRYFADGKNTETREKLKREYIKTFPQDGSGFNDSIEAVVVSTAVEESNVEYALAVKKALPIIHRADMLAAITKTKKTIAISGTSGKSTTVAMLYNIMKYAGYQPSLISGAGLTSLIKKGKIGNSVAGNGAYLIIEADESDGTLTKYHPDTGLILNIEKDHKELSELDQIFKKFKQNIKNTLIVNQSQIRSREFSVNKELDFGYETECGINAKHFKQNGYQLSFKINDIGFEVPAIGAHNMENALAAVAVAYLKGISLKKSSEALKNYEGIYRRMQIIGEKDEITLIDDYAHNPVKIAAAIKACQPLAKRVIAWFQPHGFGPTKFLKNEFINEVSNVLRKNDQIWMSEIYYAGGTVTKDISANDLITGIKQKGKHAFFVENREDFPLKIKKTLIKGDIILLMGARDPSLEHFADFVFEKI